MDMEMEEIRGTFKPEIIPRETGGKMVTAVRLFDLYRGEKIGANKKSLAYSSS